MEWRTDGYWRLRPAGERVRNAQIPAQYAEARIEECSANVQTMYSTWVRKRLSLKGIGLLFTGGAEPEYCGAALLNDLLGDPKRKVCGFYVDAGQLTQLFYAEMHNGALEVVPGFDNTLKMRYLYYEWDLLVIGRFGQEQRTPYLAGCMASLIANRRNRNKPTIVCSSTVTKENLSELYGESVSYALKDALQIDAR